MVSRGSWLAVLAVVATACQCGGHLRQEDRCLIDPSLCDAGVGPVVDAGAPDAGALDAGPGPDAGHVCMFGSITGRVCAPDQQTWVNGATVTLDGTDCNGLPVHASTTSGSDGSFRLDDLPPGQWTVHAELGQFKQDTPVTVVAAKTTAIPDNQLCVAQKTVKLAVVTGTADKIENLLSALNLTYTTYAGDPASFGQGAAPFLSSLAAMKQYDMIFFDCGAAKLSGVSTIDFGANAAAIQQNLRDYVAQGGSVYASDWALLFTVYSAPGAFSFLTNGGGAVANPFNANLLMGYAPQTVIAQVTDPGLATFLGKGEVTITFPNQSGAYSAHWGLLQSIDPTATVLVQASTVQTCTTADTKCQAPGVNATSIPLAVELRLAGTGVRKGHVVYTAFHNIAQSTDDVSKILKYLILHL